MKKSFYILISLLLLFLFAGCSEVKEIVEKIKGTEETNISKVEPIAKSITLPTELYRYKNLIDSDPIRYIFKDNTGLNTYYISKNGIFIDEIQMIQDGYDEKIIIDVDSDALPTKAVVKEGVFDFNYTSSNYYLVDITFTYNDGEQIKKDAFDYSSLISNTRSRRSADDEPNEKTLSLASQFIAGIYETAKTVVENTSGNPMPISGYGKLIIAHEAADRGLKAADKHTSNYDKALCTYKQGHDCKTKCDKAMIAHTCNQCVKMTSNFLHESYDDSCDNKDFITNCKDTYLYYSWWDLGYYQKENFSEECLSCREKYTEAGIVVSTKRAAEEEEIDCQLSIPENFITLDSDDCSITDSACEINYASTATIDSATCMDEKSYKIFQIFEMITKGFEPTGSKKNTKKCYPDTDGDNVIDDYDKCLSEKGEESLHGCPDEDGDYVPDSADDCLGEKGTYENKGCPECDETENNLVDGVCIPKTCETDKYDCPTCQDNEILLYKSDGSGYCEILDSDGDGIIDSEDGCPTEYGLAKNNGCPQNDVIVLNLTDKRSVWVNNIQINTNTKLLYNIKIEDIGKFTFYLHSSATNFEVIVDGENVENLYINGYIKKGEYIVSIENITDNNLTIDAFNVILSEFDDEDGDSIWDEEDVCLGTPSFVKSMGLLTDNGCTNVNTCTDLDYDNELFHVGGHFLQTSVDKGFYCEYRFVNWNTRDGGIYNKKEEERFFYEGESPHSSIKNGLDKYNHTNEKANITTEYNMGVIGGEHNEFYEDGSKAREALYIDGKICTDKSFYYDVPRATTEYFFDESCDVISYTHTCRSGSSYSYDGTPWTALNPHTPCQLEEENENR